MSEEEINPYAAPQSDPAHAPEISESNNGFYYSDGRHLYIKDGAELPAICPITNEPVAPNGWRQRKKIAWSPGWLWLLLIIGIFIPLGLVVILPLVIILGIILTKRAHFSYSLCDRIQRKNSTFMWIGVFLLFTGIGGFVWLFTSLMAGDEALAGLAVGPIGMLLAIIAFANGKSLKPRGHRDGWFKIKGCSTDFLSNLPKSPTL